MSTIPFVEAFPKSLFTRTQVEAQRAKRLAIPGVISSVITEDPVEFMLTTLTPGDDDAALPAPIGPAAPPARLAPAPAAPARAVPSPPPHNGSAAPVIPASTPLMGLDSLGPAKAARLAAVTTLFGVKPAFWGRYVYAPGQVNSGGARDGGHYSTAENGVLKGAGCRLLLIARQTGRVGLNAAEATTDAKNNIAAIFELFPPDFLAATTPRPLVFLDCENAADQPHLSAEYYAAWSDGIVQGSTAASGGRVRMRPAMYGSRGDVIAWASLRSAVQHGAEFAGAWIAAWQEDPAPVSWSDNRTLPTGGLPAPVLAWQYSNRGPGCDTDIANPTQSAALLEGLVLPG